MRQQGRNVVLLVDNAPCHAIEDGMRLLNTRVEFLPFNTTALVQPMDQGVIAAFKKRYKGLLARKQLCALEAELARKQLDASGAAITLKQFYKSFTIRDALNMAHHSWSDIPQSAIQNCFKKAWRLLGVPCVDRVGACGEVEATAAASGDIPQPEIPEHFEDDELPCYGEYTRKEFAEMVLKARDAAKHEVAGSDSEEDVEDQTPVSSTPQVLMMLADIKVYLDKKKMDTCLLERLQDDILSAYDDAQVQTRLEKYFEMGH